jgi:hypothetical protein
VNRRRVAGLDVVGSRFHESRLVAENLSGDRKPHAARVTVEDFSPEVTLEARNVTPDRRLIGLQCHRGRVKATKLRRGDDVLDVAPITDGGLSSGRDHRAREACAAHDPCGQNVSRRGI